ncbi:MAG: DUF1311 domain-containing protein [Clostridium sp.]|jgi:uncharacterized protein YecT (DUF1311 family)|uniref:lysozyme inhibitor LprI family protein n=1 Tax=Clostridium sp. TaxID=1506 RepID=UPI0025B890B6|nr:lysozyme inhibitor LprI family protein [Clostridium sp.]MCH3965190.1 DUF1311 domain-containing protein [Clostridium sp.]MCI1714410.1 DUF1311 domain-containing protein [Clostridium sp.]MCI1798672.1 DUF1311 domain-containing protein [Clostridium sp.]MCI1812597.1 DUF1311 domain-containing protein [Clostridium sp.]MCI1869481.1 DUF1311 domain-containing protein [Clostridium sp.]
MKNKKIVLFIIMALLILALVACTKGSKENQNYVSEPKQNQRAENSLDKVDNSNKKGLSDLTNGIKQNDNIQKDNTITKVEERRKEFLGKLDNIQKELDDLPEKKDSDSGITNAMKSYYGKSYDMYDKALNEIYALLKKELSPEIMKNLKNEQIKWIEWKEDMANKEGLKYNGGTFENVAYYMSLYNSTKKRCYELVNKYMTN